ncbi:MAG TPA: alpha/beta fold hydrolase [Planktothrix sp.]|jgi:proline iminopeptidase
MLAKIRDTEIFFDVDGAALVPDGPRMVDKPTMFAIHGGPGMDHSGYKSSLPPLSDKVQIVYFDHRGQGRSARGAKESYTLENNVEDMEALRQHLGLGKIVLLGGSYGGMVAMSYAIRYPQNVSHLIAAVTSSEGRCLERAKQIVKERGSAEQQEAAKILFDGAFEDEEHMRDTMEALGPIYSQKYDAQAAKERRGRQIVSPDAINFAFGGFLRTYNITAELHKISSPTLVIGARHDWICAPEFSEIIARNIPNSDLRIFENSGHWVAADEHQNFIDVIRGFLTYNS